jgi:Na+-driven multidrug efflux pump
MGFNGAAVASIIAEFTGMFVIFLVIHNKGISEKFSLFRQLRLHRTTARLILKVSGPLAFQHAASILSWFFFYMLIARNASQTGLAISTTMRTVFGFFGTFFWSLAATTNSMVSNVIGQGKKEEVIDLVGKITRLSAGVSIIVCVVLNLFPGLYLSLFRSDPVFISDGIPVLRCIAFAMILLSAGTVWLNAVTGTGNSRITFLIEMIAIVFYCLYVFVVLEIKKMPILWGWMSEVIYWTILFSFSYAYMKSNRWKATVI